MTVIVLKSMLLHETQIKLQNSLLLTPRLPIDGKPCKCKQEVADSIVMAGLRCMNQTAEMAKPQITNVDGTTLLGGELVERVCGVNKGGRMEHEGKLCLQKSEFYWKEDQCNENANTNIPNAHGVLLEEELAGCVSGEMSNPKTSKNTSNAAVEHADGSCE